MSKEKQISEMAYIVARTDDTCKASSIALALYGVGYRKQKEGERKHTEEPMGWHDVDVAECSACGESWVIDDDLDIELILDYWHYCPHCGAYMRKEDEGK